MRAPGHAQGERSRFARYCPPAHQPPPAAGRPGTAAGEGAAGPPRRARGRVGPSRHPYAVAGVRSALSLRPLQGPRLELPPHPRALLPRRPCTPLPFSPRRLATPPRATHPLRGWRAVALRALVLPPPTPPGGWDKINDNYRFSDLTIIVRIDNLSTAFISHVTIAHDSICICSQLDLYLQGQFIV